MKTKENMRIVIDICEVCRSTGFMTTGSFEKGYSEMECPNCNVDPEPEQDDTRQVLNA